MSLFCVAHATKRAEAENREHTKLTVNRFLFSIHETIPKFTKSHPFVSSSCILSPLTMGDEALERRKKKAIETTFGSRELIQSAREANADEGDRAAALERVKFCAKGAAST